MGNREVIFMSMTQTKIILGKDDWSFTGGNLHDLREVIAPLDQKIIPNELNTITTVDLRLLKR